MSPSLRVMSRPLHKALASVRLVTRSSDGYVLRRCRLTKLSAATIVRELPRLPLPSSGELFG